MNKQELVNHENNTWGALFVGLDMYGIKYGYDYNNITVNNSVMVTSYELDMVNTTKWRELEGLAPELTQMAQLQDESKVRVSFSGMTYRIEVPKPKHLHNKVSIESVLRSGKDMSIGLGLSAYSNTAQLVDFSGNDAGHMLVSGSTRCGKTNVLKVIAIGLISSNSPDNMRLAIIDTVKATKYDELKNSAHLAVDILDSNKKALAFLNWVKNTILKLQGRKMGKKVMILIDEMFFLMENKEIKALMRFIASTGAESGFHIIAATQYTNVDNTGGRQFKGNLMTRVAGPTDDNYGSKMATGRDKAGAEFLSKPGDFLVVDEQGMSRVAIPFVDEYGFRDIERGMSPIAKLNWEADEPVTFPEAKAPSIDLCFDKIDPRLLHLAINGKHKNGRHFGADVIRKASTILSRKGMGDSIGQSTAQHYVNFAKKYRSTN